MVPEGPSAAQEEETIKVRQGQEEAVLQGKRSKLAQLRSQVTARGLVRGAEATCKLAAPTQGAASSDIHILLSPRRSKKPKEPKD